MRLICGLLRLDGGTADPARLEAMVRALTPPGLRPATVRRTEGPAALAVMDFAAPADQPAQGLCQCADGGWLALDLRLDRRDEQAQSLGLKGTTDPKDIAKAAVLRWDLDVPDRLDGDFALAAWKPKDMRLILAVDYMGVRPLCWTHQPGRLFAFASLPKGLHASGIARPVWDEPALGRLLIQPYGRAHETGFQDIARLEGGHSLAVTPQGIRRHQAWRLQPLPVWRGSGEEAAETMQGFVEQAVASRLQGTGPVGCHLSGGFDSSSIAVIAARRLRPTGRKLHAFSIMADRWDGLDINDERRFVEAVLQQEPDIAASFFHASHRFLDSLQDPDLPLDDMLALIENEIAKTAAGAGVSLVLSGVGGDEGATLNSQAALHAALLTKGRPWPVLKDLSAMARNQGRGLPGLLAERLLRPLFVPEGLRAWRRRLLGRPQPYGRAEPLDFLAGDLRRRVQATVEEAPRFAGLRLYGQAGDVTGRINRWSLIGAAHGVAYSFPLLDRKLTDFVLSLPLERFLSGGRSRQPFRNAMRNILPKEIRLRESKYQPLPDLPLRLAQDKGLLLARLGVLRQEGRAAAWFDLEAVAAVLHEIPEAGEARRAAEEANGGQPVPARLRHVLNAVRALKLASRLTGVM